MTTHDTPQVWIGCLAAYNAGTLHGEWVDATDADHLREEQQRILAASPVPNAEEAFIADYDGFGDLASPLGEYPSLETVANIGQLIEEHGEAFILYVGICGPLPEDVAEDMFLDAYMGEHVSEEAYAMQYADDIGFEESNSWPASYIDWERAARDLFMDFVYVNGHVFDCNR